MLAFSGGVDSTFLLKAMQMAGMRALAVTGESETMPQKDRDDAEGFCSRAGIEHIVIRTDELGDLRFSENPPDRCFYCKDGLFKNLTSDQ